MSVNRILSIAAVSALAATGVRQGEWMGSKAHLVYRDVTLAGKQTVAITLRAPKGKRVRGLALDEDSTVGFTALDRHLGGKRQVRARVYVADHRGKAEVTGRVYALVR